MSEMERMRWFRARGKKGDWRSDPADPARRRANKAKGRGTYDNDRRPIVRTVGRESHQVRLRVVKHTDGQTLCQHVHAFTQKNTQVYTDEWQGYNRIKHSHATACHSSQEWAHDDDGDGLREVHVNSAEGKWTTIRNSLRPFRGVQTLSQ
jgi:transposase